MSGAVETVRRMAAAEQLAIQSGFKNTAIAMRKMRLQYEKVYHDEIKEIYSDASSSN